MTAARGDAAGERAVTGGARSLVVVVADCLRADSLGGPDAVPTPAIDALRGESCSFTRAYASSSWTKTAVATMLTGVFPAAHRAYAVSSALPAELPTLAGMLRDGGFATACITSNVYFADRSGLERGFDEVRFFQDKDGRRLNEAFDEIYGRVGDGRHFIYLHYMDAHLPYLLPDDALTAAHRRVAAAYGRTTLRDMEALGMTPEEAGLLRDVYRWEVAYLDALVGELLETLRRGGTWGETAVVVTADHGSEFAEHGGVYHGHTLYEESTRVPLLVKGAAAPGAAAVDLPVGHVDLVPTLLDLLGLPHLPDAHGRSLAPLMAGEAAPEGDRPLFAELLQFPAAHLESVVRGEWKLIRRGRVSWGMVLSQLWRNLREGNWHIFRSVFRGGRKLLGRAGKGTKRAAAPLELYHLPSDPRERRNRAGDSPEKARELRELLQRYRTDFRRYFADADRAVRHDRELKERLKALGYVD